MKIQIVGVGVVGGAQAYLLSRLGHEVLGIDRGKTAHDYARIISRPEADVDITFVCTQELVVPEVIRDLVEREIKGVYVIKSTVPPGTTRGLMEKHGIHICHNPEFLVEKRAREDILHPHVAVIGQCCPEHGDILAGLYRPLGCPIVQTQPTASETAKLTLNAYLSTLISFWNELDQLAGALGIGTDEVARITRFNPRVSPYGTEFFGSPFGGKCLPKDLDQLIQSYHLAGLNPRLLEAIRDFNRTLSDNRF